MEIDYTLFYVYVILRLDGRPCYIGKGKGERYLFHQKVGAKHHNKHLARIYAKEGGELPVYFLHWNLTEEEALLLEVAWIEAIGRGRNGPLANKTDGGEGFSGGKHSPATKRRMSEAQKGRVVADETRAKLSAANKGRVYSGQQLENMRAGFRKPRTAWNKGIRGSVFSRSGVPISEAHREKLRRAWTPERKAAQSERCAGTPLCEEALRKAAETNATRIYVISDETRRKISDAKRGKPNPHRGAPKSQETRDKISATKRLRNLAPTLA